MKHFAFATLVAALMALLTMPVSAANFGNEHLNYQIVYHWGMIWKHAGDASLSLKKTGNGYVAQLTGRTRSWAETFYPVRDTLRCTMKSNFAPLKYEKLTHEKDYYARDVVDYSYRGNETFAVGKRYRPGRATTSVNLSAKCQAYDMLSVFYMLRTLDFASMTKNKPYTTVIFSGKEKEYLTIRYRGAENVKLRDGSKHSAYHLVFKFTQKGGTKSSDDMHVWVATEGNHIPLMLSGSLPFGEVKCYLTK